MARIDYRAGKQTSMAAFALTILSPFILAAGVTRPLQAQTVSADLQAPAVTHNTWTTGTATPRARIGSAAAALGNHIYVIGDYNVSSILGINEICENSHFGNQNFALEKK